MHKREQFIPKSYIDHYTHVNHGKYFEMYEKAQEDFLNERKISFDDIEKEHGLQCVQRALKIEYIKPLFIGDKVQILTRVKSVGNTSFTFNQIIQKGVLNVSDCETVYVFIKPTGEKSSVSEEIRRSLLS